MYRSFYQEKCVLVVRSLLVSLVRLHNRSREPGIVRRNPKLVGVRKHIASRDSLNSWRRQPGDSHEMNGSQIRESKRSVGVQVGSVYPTCAPSKTPIHKRYTTWDMVVANNHPTVRHVRAIPIVLRSAVTVRYCPTCIRIRVRIRNPYVFHEFSTHPQNRYGFWCRKGKSWDRPSNLISKNQSFCQCGLRARLEFSGLV